MKEVREQLECNATDEYKSQYVTYTHSNEVVDDNIDYFKTCWRDQLSSYKALLFLSCHLEEKNNK
jgi:hypothetical protein